MVSNVNTYVVVQYFDMKSDLILVDENDNQIGTEEKMKAHLEGKLHRGFSILVFNSKGEMMLQKRAISKYHSGGLWANTCCSHPKPGEETLNAAHRRLQEEMGFDCKLKEVFDFIYKVKLDKGLTEHEYLHVFFGTYDKDPILNKDETDNFKWISMEDLQIDVKENPNNYTYWFKVVIPKIVKYLNQ